MASYKYEVVGADGKPKTGTIEAMNMDPYRKSRQRPRNERILPPV